MAKITRKRSKLAEVDTKTVSGVEYQRSDFLVVEDPEDVSTWHMPVSLDGEPDHMLMGAAKAALTVGYRGSKYEGPDKMKALEKLKAMYKSEEMEWSEAASKPRANLREQYGYDSPNAVPYVPFGAHSFADLHAAEEAQEASAIIRDLTFEFGCLVNNIYSDPAVTDKLPAIQTVIDELSDLITETLGGVTEPEDETITATEFAESDAGHVLSIAEAGSGSSGVLYMDVALIKPGFGNKRDNHYYPRAILERDAKVFEGVKMYSTDHRDEEKSERTEVSKIEKIVGFTEAGEPIARVAVFDPYFAEKTRNRSAAGMLDSLECSILASGRAKRGTIDGKPNVNIVEVITAAKSVDWVTKAGAGGRAIRLAEAQAQEDEMKKKKTDETEEVETDTTDTTASESEPVTIAEGEATTDAATTSTPTQLSEGEVTTALAATRLPAISRARLAEGAYLDTDSLNAAIAREIAYLKEITGSGKPLQLDSTPTASAPRPLAEVNKTLDAVNKKYLRG